MISQRAVIYIMIYSICNVILFYNAIHVYNFSVNVLCLLILMNNKHEIWGF